VAPTWWRTFRTLTRPRQEIADYLGDSDNNHTRNLIGAYIWVVGALLFLCFVSRLRSVLRAAEGGTGILSNIVFGAGVIYSALMIASAVAFGAVAYAVGLRDATVSEVDLVRGLPQMAWLLIWVLAASIVLLMRPEETANAAAAPGGRVAPQ
jgi:hypothetical protein